MRTTHTTPKIKTPKQLIIEVVLAFVVVVTVVLLLAMLAASGRIYDKDSPAMSAEEVAKRIKPVADEGVGPAAAGAKFKEPAAPVRAAAVAASKPDGKKVYESTCMVCHAAGVANAPKFGDKKAWVPHLAYGAERLYETVLKGKGAMPPKGGNLTLSNAEVRAALDYMLGAVK